MESKKQPETKQVEPVVDHNAVQAQVGFDADEPRTLLIAGFGIATLIALVAVILGLQFYFDKAFENQVYEKVLSTPSASLQTLRNHEEESLNNYKFLDRDKGVVQIPIKRSMELLAKEAAEGKLKYFQKQTAYKVPGAEVPAEAGAAAPANGTAAPAGGAAPGGANGTPQAINGGEKTQSKP